MDKEFLETLPEDLVNELTENIQYKSIDDSWLVSRQQEMDRKKKELHRMKSDLEIVKQQEGDNNTEIETKNLEYWMTSLDNHKSNLSAIQAVEDQLRAMKEKYERKKLFFEGRVQGAKAELERKQNKKSKPEIKLNYKIEELEKEIEGYTTQYNGSMKYKSAKEKYDKLYSSWKQKKFKKLAESLSTETVEMNSTPQPKNTYIPPKKEEEVKPQHPPVIQNTKEATVKKTPKIAPKRAVKVQKEESDNE
jgi:hypothetical protein